MSALIKSVFAFFVFLTSFSAFCQEEIPWKEDYRLELDNFKSKQSKIDPSLNSVYIQSGATIDFSFSMSSYEFMFTKNFNSKVRTIFKQNLAVISAPDSLDANYLLDYSRYDFDLHELYARKLRKELYEQKGAFSDVSFFQPIYEKLQDEMSSENSRVLNETHFGSNSDILKSEHESVRIQILELGDFCMECKPPKKKK
ncbi:hypothetical protein [Algoriphagus aquimarinus]|uniref:Uncharacterized protein n=1 Tax=Algoriphagus aquimarinus TaxID=237018 RepID=A0A1I1CHK3_9BACT|nr:hypothetical protein [Algoriphagus aquimarinus]SFB59933.1 hypothetical protein SAMN04489723_1287 [Algoriphagus aquimarinus]